MYLKYFTITNIETPQLDTTILNMRNCQIHEIAYYTIVLYRLHIMSLYEGVFIYSLSFFNYNNIRKSLHEKSSEDQML